MWNMFNTKKDRQSQMEKQNNINIAYLIFWLVVSFVSSFLVLFEGVSWEELISEDLLHKVFSPIFLWIVAFLGDYIYTVVSINEKTHILNPYWVKMFYILIEFIFIFLFLCIHIKYNLGKAICVALIYIFMLGLKLSSLYIACPRRRIESVEP